MAKKSTGSVTETSNIDDYKNFLELYEHLKEKAEIYAKRVMEIAKNKGHKKVQFEDLMEAVREEVKKD